MLQLMASMSSVAGAESLQDIWAMMESGLSPRPVTPRHPNVDSMCACNFFLCLLPINANRFPHVLVFSNPLLTSLKWLISVTVVLFHVIRQSLFVSPWCVYFSHCSGCRLICIVYRNNWLSNSVTLLSSLRWLASGEGIRPVKCNYHNNSHKFAFWNRPNVEQSREYTNIFQQVFCSTCSRGLIQENEQVKQ